MRYRFLNPKNVEVQNLSNGSYFFPSKEFPLSSKNLKLFEVNTTESLQDEDLVEAKRIADQIDVRIGYCYSNCERFIEKHRELNSKLKYHCYTGWLILPTGYPIHHAWIVVNEKSVVDFTMSEAEIKRNSEILHLPIEDQREIILQDTLEAESLPNSQKMLLGLVPETIVYIGTKSSPNMGRILYNKAKEENGSYQYDRGIFTDPNHLQNQLRRIKGK